MRHIRLTAIFFLQAISTWATAPSRIAAFATTLIVLFLIDVWFHSSGKNKFCTEFQTEPVYVYTSGTTWWVRRSAEVPTIPPILSQPALSNKKMTFGLLSFVFCLSAPPIIQMDRMKNPKTTTKIFIFRKIFLIFPMFNILCSLLCWIVGNV